MKRAGFRADARRPRGRLGVALATAALAAALATTAQAQLEPLTTPGETTGADTQYTPVAKPPPDGLVKAVSGAAYREGKEPDPSHMVPGSQVGFEVDLLAVRFRTKDDGLAAGAACRSAAEDPKTCTRVPAIYSHDPAEGWQRELLADDEGFIASVAFIDENRALAVGGSGLYPRREKEGTGYCDPEAEPPSDRDNGGTGRVFYYERGKGWRELENLPDGTDGDELPDGLTTLTAVDFYVPRPNERNKEFGIIGGLCQIWHWSMGSFLKRSDGAFEQPFSYRSSGTTEGGNKPLGISQLRWRVHSVSFARPAAGLEPIHRRPRAYAALGGCCAPAGAEVPGPVRMTYQIANDTVQFTNENPAWPTWPQDNPNPATYGAWTAARATTSTAADPDSLVSVTASSYLRRVDQWNMAITPQVGYIATHTGPSTAGFEPPSQVGDSTAAGRRIGVTNVRLLAGDGDSGGGTPSNLGDIRLTRARAGLNVRLMFGGEQWVGGDIPQSVPDGVPDWSVGEAPSSGRGVIYGTDPHRLPQESAIADPPPLMTEECIFPVIGSGITPDEVLTWSQCVQDRGNSFAAAISEDYTGEVPTSVNRIQTAARSHKLLTMPTYRLNAISVAGDVGWAAGDHGTVARLDFNSSPPPRASGAEPPKLDRSSEARLADDEAWGEADPGGHAESGPVGAIPPILARPKTQTAEPVVEQVSGSSRTAPSVIVMSRDGSEGWAIDAGNTGKEHLPMRAFHYDGSSWRFCGPDGRATTGPIDPACDGIKALQDNGFKPSVATRVPLERDTDPANDDEFEVVAAGLQGAIGRKAIARYRRGRWDLVDAPAIAGVHKRPIDIAFTAPDDGWIVWNEWKSSSSSARQLWSHFDGASWSTCAEPLNQPSPCDPQVRLPFQAAGSVMQLSATGGRLYAAGVRARGASVFSNATAVPVKQPFLIYRTRDEPWSASVRPGEYDPNFGTAGGDGQRAFLGFSVIQRRDGQYEGWMHAPVTGAPLGRESGFMRLTPGSERWRPFVDRSITTEMRAQARHPTRPTSRMAISPDRCRAAGCPAYFGFDYGRVYQFLPERQRLQVLPLRRAAQTGQFWQARFDTSVHALAPDGEGGLWTAAGGPDNTLQYLYHYTDRPRVPVFEETAHPSATSRGFSALATDRRGTVWLATDSGVLHRRSRRLGWDSFQIPGWETARVVTQPARATALSIHGDGYGLVVGEGGRIARIERTSVRLDPAAGNPCSGAKPVPPCGTANHLRAVSVAPDGSAMAVGDQRTVLWRPGRGEFRTVSTPAVSQTHRIQAVSMPGPRQSWVVVDNRVWRGDLSPGGVWSWTEERLPEAGIVNSLAIRRDGTGYATGRKGVPSLGTDRWGVWERSSAGSWEMQYPGSEEELDAVALDPAGHEAVLVGGARGLILTLHRGRFEVARPGATEQASEHGDITGLALVPARGPAEAWAISPVEKVHAADRLLRYSSDGGASMTPGRRLEPIPDRPAKREGELQFAAFGKSDCQSPAGGPPCFEMFGTNDYAELVSERIADELAARARSDASPAFTVFTGDVSDSAAYPGDQLAATVPLGHLVDALGQGTTVPGLQSFGPDKFTHWGTSVADRITDAGSPVLGAIGGQDLSDASPCSVNGCVPTKDFVRAGDTLVWRQVGLGRPAPWGKEPPSPASRYRLRRVAPGIGAVEVPNAELTAPNADLPVRTGTPVSVPTGGASTHYAVDVTSRSGERQARVVVLDNSARSLAASDPAQQPAEPAGQAAYLQRMICVADKGPGSAGCTRRPGQQAVVVMNTPTYSFLPGAGYETATDSTAVEAILMRHRANVVVSGRIGWNGVYWATAPGVHFPCPGQPHTETPPQGTLTLCGAGGQEAGVELNPSAASDGLARTLDSTGLSSVTTADALAQTPIDGRYVLPFVVASGAGGTFARNQGAGQGDTRDGFWHGYTLVRLDRSGDPRKTIFEQRPVYDWLGIDAQERVLRPGQQMSLRGFARGPAGVVVRSQFYATPVARIDRIDSAAVTHRYDLLAADPKRRWLPARDGEGNYVPLGPEVATVDRITGRIKTGRGNHPRAFAVAMLSVGKRAAAYPLIFEPRRTFEPKAASAAPRSPTVTVQSAAAGLAPPPAPGAPPQVGSVSPPALPAFPATPPPPATPPLGQPQPSPPPPPPPAGAPPTALELATAPPGLTVAPPASVIPPPAPPINPAPPGGARKEARQRQAATEKSGSDAGTGTQDEQVVDMADRPQALPGAEMTRRDRVKAEPASFTAVSHPDQPSAWARGALYGGGLTLAALALAAGWGGARPRPRARAPIAPAPARAYSRRG